MQIVVVGVNHASAPMALRERVAFPEMRLGFALEQLRRGVDEGLILSTCNRTEIYGFVGHAETGATHLTRFLADTAGLDAAALRPIAYSHAHTAAVAHLFRVAAGLESMVVGEDQIVSQVKLALDAARHAGTLGPVLSRMGNAALAVGKRVRHATGLNRHHVSVVSLAVDAAAARTGGLAGARIVLLGAGRTAAIAMRHLAESGARVTVVSRSPERAAEIAARFGAEPKPWSELAGSLANADVVISCTSAACVVLDRDVMVSAGRASGDRPLLCIDLALPRDIHPAVGELPGVTLRNLDALQTSADSNRALRQGEVAAADAVVAEHATQFMDWWRSRQVVPAIMQLREHAERIRNAEVDRALARMGDLAQRDRVIVRTLAARIVNKLLHDPITTLKLDPEGANMAQIVQHLFNLGSADVTDVASAAGAAGCPLGVPAHVPAAANVVPGSEGGP